MKRFLSLLLIATLLVPCLLVGCKENKTPAETSTEGTTEATTPEETTPEEEGNELPEGQTKLTAVTVVSGNTPAEMTAAEDLQKYLTQKGVDATAQNGFPITLSIDESLGEDAYRISATVGEGKNEGLLIVGGNGRGVLYGVYEFLEKYADVRFFTPELEICEVGDVIISDGIFIEYAPTFELRQTDWYRWNSTTSGYSWSVKNGINIVNGWNNYAWGEELGGCLSYAPGMFVHTIGKLAEMKVDYPATAPNPCLTDETIYQTVLKNVRATLTQYPNAKILSVSQNDNTSYCKCDSCEAISKEEGSPAGTLLRFVNRIANDIAQDFPGVTIDTLAYRYTQTPPKITKPAENVCIRLSTITCHFNHPLTKSGCSTCESFCKALEGWGAICDNIYIWDYTTNYAYYLATFPNLHVLRENMRFFAQNNVKGVYAQGNASGPSGEFGELRAYLIGKLMMNPYMSKSEYYAHMDEFLEAYYGEGWTYIRKYIDTFSQYANLSANGMGIYSFPFTVMHKDTFASIKENVNTWWDAAEALAGDRLEYVRRSRWQVRYLSLFAEPNAEEGAKLAAEVEANGTRWSENFPTLLWYVYEYNLFTETPDKWFKDPSAKN